MEGSGSLGHLNSAGFVQKSLLQRSRAGPGTMGTGLPRLGRKIINGYIKCDYFMQ